MKASELNSGQVEALARVVGPMLAYLSRLAHRADKALSPTDPLFRAIHDAYNAIHSLNVQLHYLACDVHKRENHEVDLRPGLRAGTMTRPAEPPPES